VRRSAEIADWLEKLGMSAYAQRFAENGINVAALSHLTDQDLKDIGVLLGRRRMMLAAIARLNDTPVAAASAEMAVLRRSPLRSQLPRRLPNLLANVGTRRLQVRGRTLD
jgi:hypothetical protein